MTEHENAPAPSAPPRLIVWGTYDLGKPRTRLLLSALKAEFDIQEIHADIWRQVEDKSQVRGSASRFGIAFRWLAAYPRLIWRYLRAPAHSLVVVPYLGHLDVIVLWPFARARRAPVLWDAFLSLWDTVVADRELASRKSMRARALWWFEWLACRAADRIVLDTRAQARMLTEQFCLAPDKATAVPVGAETASFPPLDAPSDTAGRKRLRVLFYGQFIPLHGIDTIVEAAQSRGDGEYQWVIVGEGQEGERIAERIAQGPPFPLERHRWIPYAQLREEIAKSDVCLGIFGRSDKAARVIPNKVYQILSAGRPLVTMQSPAIAELLEGSEPGVRLVPPGDPAALLQALDGLSAELTAGKLARGGLHLPIVARFDERALAERWKQVVNGALGGELARDGGAAA